MLDLKTFGQYLHEFNPDTRFLIRKQRKLTKILRKIRGLNENYFNTLIAKRGELTFSFWEFAPCPHFVLFTHFLS